MTPKEKAKELVERYAKKSNNMKHATTWNYDKQCALIAVNELLYSHLQDTTDNQFYYWEDVKREIELL